jgi:hypothetical protein
VEELETSLNDFSPSVRRAALEELDRKLKAGEIQKTPEAKIANLHCHTFYSFNAYGYSPSGLAWLAKRQGFQVIGMVDFDVLDAVDEFLDACEYIGVRGGINRAFVPEFAGYEINSRRAGCISRKVGYHNQCYSRRFPYPGTPA